MVKMIFSFLRNLNPNGWAALALSPALHVQCFVEIQ